MPDVRVAVRSTRTQYAFGEPLGLLVDVRNVSDNTVFLTLRLFARKRRPHDLRILVGQERIPKKFYYYSFVPPGSLRLAAGDQVSLPISIAMPLRESFINVDGVYSECDVPLDGNVTITVTVGYLGASFDAKTDDPWGEFIGQQRLAPPATTRIALARP